MGIIFTNSHPWFGFCETGKYIGGKSDGMHGREVVGGLMGRHHRKDTRFIYIIGGWEDSESLA
jgi:hypothetical protein